ncbi:zinc finger MYM-type protein 3-like [Mizuhopecten yessoensis]|uniref:zinc finger MYM-type protein 3-like n=1 Tax=Mizuhopecten yessoensis TaxID=6573 RepID=UPI000B458263|nr:zinc finger MYM-type protein 3-like [Mizuhopecten yessoensis]
MDISFGSVTGSRFAEPLTEENVMPLIQSSKSSNTESKVRWAVNLFRDWQKERRTTGYIEELQNDILDMTDSELNTALTFFVAEVRKVNGEEYRGNTLYEVIVGIQAFLRENSRLVRLLSDDAFKREDTLSRAHVRI